EFAVFEVGLGGRLDATNIVRPAVSIITRIDFDHENFLGHSLEEIAGEKAGIIKEGVPVVVAEQPGEARKVLLRRARELHAAVIETAQAYRLESPGAAQWPRARVIESASNWSCEVAPRLRGRFQLQNALNAVAAARVLEKRGFRIGTQAIEDGIAGAVWPGR